MMGPEKQVSNAPIYESQYSTNWGGYQYYTPNNQVLQSVSTYMNVATISMPPSDQVDSSVDQVGSAWIGISPQTGGGGGLAQTGYSRDATTSAQYYLFWEFYPVNAEQYYYSNGNPVTLSSGNTLAVSMNLYSSVVYFSVQNGANFYSTSFSLPSQYSGYSPIYYQQIVEAYSYGSTIQQIAEVSNVNFENTGVQTTSGNIYSSTDLYNQSDYLSIILEQWPNPWYQFWYHNHNINNNYIMQPGTYYGIALYGYQQESWITSEYSYSYVNG
jgi:hypothetical protein